MPFTDHSDIYAALNENGVNLVVQLVMQQRPSLFNYGTQQILDRLKQDPEILCAPIKAHPNVDKRHNPYITVEDPLIIPGTNNQLAIAYLAQLTNLQLDLSPGSVFNLPQELNPPLGEQHFALHVQVCGGVGCPTKDFLDTYTLPEPPKRGGLILPGNLGNLGNLTFATGTSQAAASAITGLPGKLGGLGGTGVVIGGIFDPGTGGQKGPTVAPFDKLTCFCIDLFLVGHIKPALQTIELLLRPDVDGVELVDVAPVGMENIVECMMMLVIKVVVLPKLAKAIAEAMQSPLKGLKDQASLTVVPTPTPASVPNNPAVEDDQIKLFINLQEVQP